MKTTMNLKGVTLVAGVPDNIRTNSSGRLTVGETYKIIGFAKVAGTTEIPQGWTGVALEKQSTKGQTVVGINTLLGTSIVLNSDGKYTISRVPNHPFTSPDEFSNNKSNGDDNGTLFKVTAITPLSVNVKIKLKDEVATSEHYETKQKDFYAMEIITEVAK